MGGPTASGAAATTVFDLPPGQTVRVVTAVAGGGQNPADPAPAARALADGQSGGSLDTLYDAHVEWWKQYWLKSYVDLNDDVLERFYYGSLYLIGSSSRAGKTAPGLYGVWATTDSPQFSGDMHLNYNWMANFYGVYSSNRTDLALPYYDLVQAYLPEARRRAQQDLRRVKPDYVDARFPCGGVPGGVLFPVGIAPFGATADDNYHQQVVNSLFTVSQYIAYYDYTRDRTFLTSKAYPFMKEVAAFFQHYLEYDAGAQRYNLYGEPHEGTWGRNSSADLGLLRNLLSTLIDASVELNVDAGDRATWTTILQRLAPIPTTTHNGRKVYALADPGTLSDGRAIRPGDNTVNLEFVHPGEALGINSPATGRPRSTRSTERRRRHAGLPRVAVEQERELRQAAGEGRPGRLRRVLRRARDLRRHHQRGGPPGTPAAPLARPDDRGQPGRRRHGGPHRQRQRDHLPDPGGRDVHHRGPVTSAFPGRRA
ncbi:hypothetical protein GCM10018952_39260 [Streptosporangium vulgare]